MKETKFRCSCCDKMAATEKEIYKYWKDDLREKVLICDNCDFVMKHLKLKYVDPLASFILGIKTVKR